MGVDKVYVKAAGVAQGPSASSYSVSWNLGHTCSFTIPPKMCCGQTAKDVVVALFVACAMIMRLVL